MRKKRQKWTYELLHKTALMYNTRGEFNKGSRSAYNACRYRGILDKVCSHMKGTPYVNWTVEKLLAESRKYVTRNEFRNANRSAYQTCCDRGILDKVCKHMKELPHWDKPHCVYLIEIFTKNNELYYYVGQTSDLKYRLGRHFRNKGSDSPVFDFLNKTPFYYTKYHIVKDNLTYKESIELERDTIKDLKDRKFNLLNKVLYI